MHANQNLPWILGGIQAIILALFFGCTTYQDDIASGYSLAEYAIFRDIMVMLLLGFGFLMTFLRKYGLGAVGFTMMLTALSIQLNILVELLCRYIDEPSSVEFPYQIHLSSFIDGEFAAATLLISFGALIGRASPLQLIIMTLCQSFFYALNKVVIVFGAWKAEDVGGTITIHMFGAYFGLAASRVMGEPKGRCKSNADPSQVSDVMCLVGTGLLWIYWPSFVGATETKNPVTEHLCVLHTILSLAGSTIATFCCSHRWTQGYKFDPVHVANATLAGGVAIGASARLELSPGGALLVGILSGIVSTYGYAYGTPFLEANLTIYDTCGVHNLHGLPSILGGLASAIFVAIDDDAEFFNGSHGIPQPVRQILAMVTTLAVSVVSGCVTGIIMKLVTLGEAGTIEEYNDAVWWEGTYMDALPQDELDISSKSKASISPVVMTAEADA